MFNTGLDSLFECSYDSKMRKFSLMPSMPNLARIQWKGMVPNHCHDCVRYQTGAESEIYAAVTPHRHEVGKADERSVAAVLVRVEKPGVTKTGDCRPKAPK